MNNQKKIYIILFLALILRFIVIYVNYHNPNFEFQQESYSYYINSLKDGSITSHDFSPVEKRLFPGYIMLILPFTNLIDNSVVIGIVLNIFLFIVSFFLVWKIFKNVLTNLIFAFFPPVWIMQTSKASSEPLTVTLLLTSLLFFSKKLYLQTGLVIGFAFSVRTVSICLLLAFLIPLFFKKKYDEIIRIILGFLTTASILFMYNYLVFGKTDLFTQFTNLDQNYGIVRIGFIQMYQDIIRTIDWGQYRILFSGIFYMIINFFSLFILFKNRKKSNLINVCFYWMLFSLLFVFSLSPFTLIENFGRYTTPASPMIAVAFAIFIQDLSRRMGLLPKQPKLSPNQK